MATNGLKVHIWYSSKEYSIEIGIQFDAKRGSWRGSVHGARVHCAGIHQESMKTKNKSITLEKRFNKYVGAYPAGPGLLRNTR